MNTRNEATVVWIGLIGVFPLSDSSALGSDCEGAYVNVLAMASNLRNYRSQAKAFLGSMELGISEIEDPEPLRNRLVKFTVSDDIIKLAKEVERTGTVMCDEFHTF